MSSAAVTRVRHRVGTIEDFELDTFQVFELDGKPVGVVRTEQGFFAVRNRCPHQGADICGGTVNGTMVPSEPHSYDFSSEVLVVACPWHRWEFELATGASFGAATKKRLVTYPVEVEEDEVYVMMRGARR